MQMGTYWSILVTQSVAVEDSEPLWGKLTLTGVGEMAKAAGLGNGGGGRRQAAETDNDGAGDVEDGNGG
jgi:hypothetical protein